jgi:hypothetical protein
LTGALILIFVQVALTFALLLRLGLLRTAEVREGRADLDAYGQGVDVFAQKARNAARAFSNQFEIPVLFFVAVIVAILTARTSTLFLVLGWLFILSRLVHAWIYSTTNYVPHRFVAFSIGFAILGLMWLLLAVSLLFGL